MTPPWLPSLLAALPPDLVATDPDIIASYARDQAPLAPAGVASALVRARAVEDVIATLRFANAHGIPVVTRGAGSGLSGGANALDGCILLSVAKLNRILNIDALGRTATVEPGVINGHLAAEVSALGLTYAPDPASRDISSIGGNIATNAGGSCCLKYGVTGDHVAALTVVLADGTVLKTGGTPRKNVAGLDLTRLLVGSEGALGVIVEATVRLMRRPPPPSTLLVSFDTLQAAGEAIAALDAVATPSLLELMDRTTVEAVEAMRPLGLDTSAAATVLLQSDDPDAPAVVARCAEVCAAHGGRDALLTDDPEEGKLLLAGRRLALPALERLGTPLLDDVSVPKPRQVELLDAISDIAARSGLVIGTFGHAGDGNLHPTIVFDNTSAPSRARAFDAFDAIVRVALALGGSITGEHGVGGLKTAYLPQQLGEGQRALMQRIKHAFDPNNILNPGRGL